MSEPSTSIVVIEDSDEVREILTLLLEAEGFQVTACEEAESGFETIRRIRPDVIVTDLMLGATSGLELITRVRSDLAPPVPPVIACSGFTSLESEACQRGAAAFIPKPFHPDTIRHAIDKVLAQEKPAPDEHDLAAEHARAQRARALDIARQALERLEPLDADLRRRVRATMLFLPRFFGFGHCLELILSDEHLRVNASSDDEIWPLGLAIDHVVCRDILETNSALVVPDLLSLDVVMNRPDGTPLRFFTGLPMSCGQVAVGALCFVDVMPRRLDSGDFSLLEALVRRASAFLTDPESPLAAIWTATGLISSEGLTIILTAMLSHSKTENRSVILLVFAGLRPPLPEAERTLVAQLADDRFALLLSRPYDADGRRELLAAVRSMAGSDGFRAGGMVLVEEGAGISFEAGDVVRTAEGLLERALHAGPGTIEQIVLQPVRLALDLAQEGD